MMSPTQFAEKVLAYCAWSGASVTSWGRTPKRNAAVGGHPRSRHLIWLGMDVVYDEPIAEEERRHMASRLGLKLVIESDHDHIQTF